MLKLSISYDRRSPRIGTNEKPKNGNFKEESWSSQICGAKHEMRRIVKAADAM